MSIARTTPAQNPRGFNNSKVFVCKFPLSDKLHPPTRVHFLLGNDAVRVSKDAPSGQCKPLRVWGLAADGEKGPVNGANAHQFTFHQIRRTP
jgi:hypothetical protein